MWRAILSYDDCVAASACGAGKLGIGQLGSTEEFEGGPAGCHIQDGASFQFNTILASPTVPVSGHTPVCRIFRAMADYEGKLRLRGGSDATHGRVELYNPAGGWGTVCDYSWDWSDAQVVCHQLGFDHPTGVHHSSLFGTGSGPIWMNFPYCMGSEDRLIDCWWGSACTFSFCGWRDWHAEGTCGHYSDAGVSCSCDYDAGPIPPPPSPPAGFICLETASPPGR